MYIEIVRQLIKGDTKRIAKVKNKVTAISIELFLKLKTKPAFNNVKPKDGYFVLD